MLLSSTLIPTSLLHTSALRVAPPISDASTLAHGTFYPSAINRPLSNMLDDCTTLNLLDYGRPHTMTYFPDTTLRFHAHSVNRTSSPTILLSVSFLKFIPSDIRKKNIFDFYPLVIHLYRASFVRSKIGFTYPYISPFAVKKIVHCRTSQDLYHVSRPEP